MTRTGLAFVGMTTIDVVQIADRLPDPDRKGWARSAYLDVGGPAANAAITAALLGGRASLHSAFGSGPAGDLVAGLVDSHGVTRVDHGDQSEVPVSSIWVDETTGTRTLLSTAAAFAGLAPGGVALNDAAAVLLDGFYPKLAVAAAEEASRLGIPIVLDCGNWREVFAELLPRAAVVIASEQFTWPQRLEAAPEDIVAGLLDQYRLDLAVVSRGSRPIVWASPEGSGRQDVPTVNAVDTLGAGDVLHGAFVYFAYQRERDHLAALELASRVAARSCEHFGTRAGVRSWVAGRSA